MSNVAGSRGLIAAIIDQAYADLLGGSTVTAFDKYTAINFVNSKNKLFCYYCDLLGYDPEYVAERIYKAVRERKISPVRRFKK